MACALISVNYWMVVPMLLAVMYIVYVLVDQTNPLLMTIRQDSIVRGPMHQLFSSVISGLVTIRAYRKQRFFQTSYLVENDRSANVTFTYYLVSRLMGVRLEYMMISVVIVTASSVAYFRHYIEPGLLAYSLLNITDIVVFFVFTMRIWAEI